MIRSILLACFIAICTPALAAEQTEPLWWSDCDVNTTVQRADPGPGADPVQYGWNENLMYYDCDGGSLIGPGNRKDITIYINAFLNLFRSHQHVEFYQPAFSATRPEQRLLWQPTYTGGFTINKYNTGGTLEIYSGATVGGGGQVSMDYATMEMAPGNSFAVFMSAQANGYQWIEIGWKKDENNKVVVARAESGSGESTWACHTVWAGSYIWSYNTGVTTHDHRRIFIFHQDGDVIKVYIGSPPAGGSSGNTARLACVITQLPVAGLYVPFVKATTLGSAVSRSWRISDFYNNVPK